jgi:hypothetical protein
MVLDRGDIHEQPSANKAGMKTIRFLDLVILALALWLPRAHAQGSCDAAKLGLAPGSEDNTAALTRALATCAGREIRVPPGVFVFRPAGFAQGFTVPDGTTLQGSGADSAAPTVFKIEDSGTFASLLWIRNASHVTVRDIRFEGPHFDSGCARHLDYGHAIYVYSDRGASSSIEDIVISGNIFHDFNGLSWVTLTAADGSPGIGLNSLIAIDKNSFVSDSTLVGGCAGRSINYSVPMISIHGSDESGQGLVESVSVRSNTFDADYVNQAVAIWSGTYRISVQYNTIRNAGLHLPGAAGELGRYAINVYNSAHEKPGLPPNDIHIVGNTIVNPVSCGVYVASGRRVEISENRISGQTDSNDVTLPKGAIALNHVEDASVTKNDIRNNYIGITAVAGTVRMDANTIAPRAGGIRTKIYRSDNNPAEIQK